MTHHSTTLLHFLPLSIPSDSSRPSGVIWNWINRWLSMKALSSPEAPSPSLRGLPTPWPPSRNPSWLYSELCLLVLPPLRFLKRPQWPLGWQSLDMDGGEEGAWRSRSFYLCEQMGTSATSAWLVSPIKNTGGAENMSMFQLRALECWDNVVMRSWMNVMVHPFWLLPRRHDQYFPRTVSSYRAERKKVGRKRRVRSFWGIIVQGWVMFKIQGWVSFQIRGLLLVMRKEVYNLDIGSVYMNNDLTDRLMKPSIISELSMTSEYTLKDWVFYLDFCLHPFSTACASSRQHSRQSFPSLWLCSSAPPGGYQDAPRLDMSCAGKILKGQVKVGNNKISL